LGRLPDHGQAAPPRVVQLFVSLEQLGHSEDHIPQLTRLTTPTMKVPTRSEPAGQAVTQERDDNAHGLEAVCHVLDWRETGPLRGADPAAEARARLESQAAASCRANSTALAASGA